MQLDEVRSQIDEVDTQIRELFIRRMKLADEVACIKAQTEDVIYKPDREMSIIDRQSQGMEPSLLMEYRALIRRVMEISRKYQYGRTLQLRDCFPYDYETQMPDMSRLAMLREQVYICDFCSKDEVMAAESYDQIAAWIEAGQADAGAGIIEEIAAGMSDELNLMLLAHGLYINSCRVAEDQQRRLKVVAFTKHLCVRPEHNRLRLVFVAPNRSGALSSLLSMISDYGVNLTEIHSVPFSSGDDWNYHFFIEMSMNLLLPTSRALIFQLSQETQDMRLLGSYECEGDFVNRAE